MAGKLDQRLTTDDLSAVPSLVAALTWRWEALRRVNTAFAKENAAGLALEIARHGWILCPAPRATDLEAWALREDAAAAAELADWAASQAVPRVSAHELAEIVRDYTDRRWATNGTFTGVPEDIAALTWRWETLRLRGEAADLEEAYRANAAINSRGWMLKTDESASEFPEDSRPMHLIPDAAAAKALVEVWRAEGISPFSSEETAAIVRARAGHLAS